MPSLELPIIEPLVGNLALNADQTAVMLREIREISFGLGHLHELLAKGRPVPMDLARNILSLTDSRTTDLCKLIGIELESGKEREDRLARMRVLNNRVRELEFELGKQGTVQQTVEHIKAMDKILNVWWDKVGFGHISSVQITQWGSVNITFSCSLYGDFMLTNSDTPISDEANKLLWYQALADRGFVLLSVPGEREPELLDCDQNRTTLQTLFSRVFTTGSVVETTNHRNSRARAMVLRSVRVLVSDMQEIFNLDQDVSIGN